MGGGGLFEMFVTAVSLVQMMRVISRIEKDVVEPVVVPTAKITFDLPPTSATAAAPATPVKTAAVMDQSQVLESPSWLDKQAASFVSTPGGATRELDYLRAVTPAAQTPGAPAKVDSPSWMRKTPTSARQALVAPQPTPIWMESSTSPAPASSPLKPSKMGNPSWMSATPIAKKTEEANAAWKTRESAASSSSSID